MALTPGTRLGPYEVTAAIGEGGMGQVFRARDTKLGRDVAIKVLPEAFAHDAERLARFTREAKTLASLNHPNIAAIYGLEESGGLTALVMELVEGDDLSQRIARGAIPVDEALPIAKQIAEALEAAHEQGIIHRDLKPANIKVRPDGTVKVLDFGLAKAMEPAAGASPSMSMSPTITTPAMMTGVGVLLGTAAYMSPEQAKGREADKRSDIWAFGCVLYEMLTGKRVFAGDDIGDTFASILKTDPDWTALPRDMPPLTRMLVQRCLEKDRTRRIADASTVRFVIDECATAVSVAATTNAPTARRRRWLWPALAASLLVALLSVASVHFRETPPAAAQPMRFQIAMPDQVIPLRGAVLSPDGHTLVFPAVGADGVRRLWLRSLDAAEARQLSGTDKITGTRPFWSPDSRFVAFQAGEKLKKIDVAGGEAQILCDVPKSVLGGSWNRDGIIIFGNDAGGVMRVSAAGGAPIPVTAAARSSVAIDSFPAFLPDGHHFVYAHAERTSGQAGAARSPGVYVGSLEVKPGEQDRRPLVVDASVALFARAQDGRSGYVVFLRGATLFAQPFDDRGLQLTGEPVPIAEPVGLFFGDAMFSASDNGSLVYRAGLGRPVRLTWFDRQGQVLGSAAEPVDAMALALSPDGTRVAVEQRTPPRNISVVDFSRGVTTQLTFDAASAPRWSPDGARMAYESGSGIYQRPSNGTGAPERLLQSQENVALTDWSPDGRFLVYTSASTPGRADLWMLALAGDRKPVQLLRTEFNETQARVSPDARWIAYASDESGAFEIYVRSFNPPSSTSPSSIPEGKWLISKGGGTEPRWRRDGKELFYLGANGNVMAVDVAAGPVFQPGTPKALFQIPASAVIWDVSSDGQRFLLPVLVADSVRAPFTLVLNWMADLRR